MLDLSEMAPAKTTGMVRGGRTSGTLPRRRPRIVSMALVAVATALFPAALEAQDVVTFLASRQMAAEDALRVNVDFAAGHFGLRAGTAGELYRMQLAYDEAGGTPIHEYTDGRLRVGIDHASHVSRRGEGEARLDLRLTPDIPVDLTMNFGAIRGDIDLGEIPLRSLELATGASESQLRVSRPNPIALDRARIQVGAASLTARELGRLNARVLDVEAGIGEVKLDLEGLSRPDTELRVSVGMGSLEIGVPRGTGIRIDRSTFLTRLSTPPMVQRDGAYYSSDWDTAERRVTIELNAAIGSVTVMRLPN